MSCLRLADSIRDDELNGDLVPPPTLMSAFVIRLLLINRMSGDPQKAPHWHVPPRPERSEMPQ